MTTNPRAPYTVSITPTDNGGAIVVAGCKTLAFTSIAIACQEVTRYFDDPAAVLAEYSERHRWALEAGLAEIGYRERPEPGNPEPGIVGDVALHGGASGGGSRRIW